MGSPDLALFPANLRELLNPLHAAPELPVPGPPPSTPEECRREMVQVLDCALSMVLEMSGSFGGGSPLPPDRFDRQGQ